ncbi:hemolysin-III related-domain-containing protein [Chytriomyces sp. MP71]|nr:hemolysin-III related-domain-containing protein [Chytriomyces sp. MP71]
MRDEMPAWYQHEPFIWSGYRPIKPSYKHCLNSLAYWHNETGNIYTHLIGALLFIGLLGYTYGPLFTHSSMDGVGWRDILAFLAMHLGITSCFVLSVAFHLFCCHSQEVHRACLRADYAGIVFQIGGCFITSVSYAFYCDKTLQAVYIAMILLSGAATIFTNISSRFMKPRFGALRLFLFIAFGFLGLIPIAHSCILHGFELTKRSIAFNYLLLVALFDVGGALIFHFRIPERFAPGRFDYIGSSHQIMHVAIVLGAVAHYLGTMEAFTFWHRQNGQCDWSVTAMNLTVGNQNGWWSQPLP